MEREDDSKCYKCKAIRAQIVILDLFTVTPKVSKYGLKDKAFASSPQGWVRGEYGVQIPPKGHQQLR